VYILRGWITKEVGQRRTAGKEYWEQSGQCLGSSLLPQSQDPTQAPSPAPTAALPYTLWLGQDRTHSPCLWSFTLTQAIGSPSSWPACTSPWAGGLRVSPSLTLAQSSGGHFSQIFPQITFGIHLKQGPGITTLAFLLPQPHHPERERGLLQRLPAPKEVLNTGAALVEMRWERGDAGSAETRCQTAGMCTGTGRPKSLSKAESEVPFSWKGHPQPLAHVPVSGAGRSPDQARSRRRRVKSHPALGYCCPVPSAESQARTTWTPSHSHKRLTKDTRWDSG